MKTICIVLVLLSIQTLAQVVVQQQCSFDSDCGYYTFPDLYFCNTTLSSCQLRTKVLYQGIVGAGTCQNSFASYLFPIGYICTSLSTLGCPITLQTPYRECVSGTIPDYNLGQCVTPPVITFNTTYLNQRCSFLLPCDSPFICIQSVCRNKLNEGENCYSSTIPCQDGLICDGDICRKSFSKQPQEYCKTSQVCASNACISNACLERRSVSCYNNSDCATDSCYKTSPNVIGKCIQSQNYAQSLFFGCVGRQCPSLSASCIQSCQTDYIRYKCAQNCPRRPDFRKETSPVLYDCTALTMTTVPKLTCEYTQSYFNCPSVPYSSGSQILFNISIIFSVLIFMM